MEKKYYFFILILILSQSHFAQNKDSTYTSWVPSLKTKVNISQIAFKDWAKGGEDTFTWGIQEVFKLHKRTEKWRIRNKIEAAYGRTKSGSESFRTNNNELSLESVVSLKIGWAVDPFIGNSIRTQLTEGFNYKKKPAKRIANFFDPAYITQSFGFTYDKFTNFRTRLGLAFQEIITNNYRQYSDDEETTNKLEAFKFETGLETVTTGKVNLMENIDLKSKLRLFTRFEQLDVWDVLWDSTIVGKVNSFIKVNLNLVLIYERSQSPRTQIKEALQLGIVYTVI